MALMLGVGGGRGVLLATGVGVGWDYQGGERHVPFALTHCGAVRRGTRLILIVRHLERYRYTLYIFIYIYYIR